MRVRDQIVEDGIHSALLAKEGLYTNLWDAQQCLFAIDKRNMGQSQALRKKIKLV